MTPAKTRSWAERDLGTVPGYNSSNLIAFLIFVPLGVFGDTEPFTKLLPDYGQSWENSLNLWCNPLLAWNSGTVLCTPDRCVQSLCSKTILQPMSQHGRNSKALNEQRVSKHRYCIWALMAAMQPLDGFYRQWFCSWGFFISKSHLTKSSRVI